MNNFSSPRNLADALWLFVAKARGGEHWVANSHCRVDSICIADQNWPLSVIDSTASDESYVASPIANWLAYPQTELLKRNPYSRLNPLLKLCSQAILSPLRGLLLGSQLQHASILANKLISTNLYPDWQARDLSEARQNVLDQYPERPLMLRNICPALHPNMTLTLQEQGWHLVPTRIVYLCDTAAPDLWKHNHVRQDKKLLSDNQVEILSPHQLQRQDIPQLRRVFRSLFIDKHSQHNPDFTQAFFEMCMETGFLELFALRYQGKLCGVLGIYEYTDPTTNQRWLTTPLIGYDCQAAQELGLYRRLMALLLEQAAQRQAQLHYSSGAGNFKRLRGGIPHLEYTAIYGQHLSRFASTCLAGFASSMRLCTPSLLLQAEK